MLRNSDLIRKVENGQLKMLLRWRGDMIRLNAIMGNVDLCKSIEEAFQVESKNNGKLLFDDIFVSRKEKISKTEHKINGVHWRGNVIKNSLAKALK
jgi:hypothetical protein